MCRSDDAGQEKQPDHAFAQLWESVGQAEQTLGQALQPAPVSREDLKSRPTRRIFDRLERTEAGALRCPSCRQKRTEGFVLLQDGDRGAWVQCTSRCTTEDILAAIGLSTRQLTAEGWPRPRVLTAADLDQLPATPPMIIGDLVRQGSGLLLHGKTSLGKTYLALEMAWALLVSGNWLGVKVEKLPDDGSLVLFLCRDWPDAHDFRDRIKAIFRDHPARHRILVMTATELDESERQLGYPLTFDNPAGLLDLVEDAGGDEGVVKAVFIEPLDQFRSPAQAGTDPGEMAGAAMAGVRKLWGRVDLVWVTHEDRKALGDGADTAYGSVKVVNRMPCALRLSRHEKTGFVFVETSKPGRGGHMSFYARFSVDRGCFERVPDSEAPNDDDNASSREKVVDALREAGTDGMSYVELEDATGLKNRALTKHVGRLKSEGLVERQSDGKSARFCWRGDDS